MPEIEFIEIEQAQPFEPVVRRPLPDRATLLRLIPAVLGLGAAALAAWAPFRYIYTLSEPRGGISVSSTDPSGNGKIGSAHVYFDAWGRARSDDPSVSTLGSHGVRFGIVLAAAAGICLVAGIALARAAIASHGRPNAPILWSGRSLAIVGLSVAAAMSATTYLSYVATKEAIDQLNKGNTTAFAQRLGVSPGDCWLVAAGAALLALLALVLTFVFARVAPDHDGLDRSDSQQLQNLATYGADIYPPGEHL